MQSFYSYLQTLWITSWCSSDAQTRAAKIAKDPNRYPLSYTIYSGGQEVLETKFTSSSDMDDMFFQCNKDAIYVLNSNYAYAEFSHLNLVGTLGNNMLAAPQGNNCATEGLYRSKSLCETSTVAQPAPASHGLSSATLQKLFRSSHNEKQQSHQGGKQLSQTQQNFSKCKTNSTAMTTKKCASVKSAIIAKKTKFWKYLEEEKWKSSIENLSTTNTDPDRGIKLTMKNSSTGSNNNKTNITSDNNNSRSSSTRSPRSGGVHTGSYNSNNNNNNNNNSKSSTELYREAAQLLGLSCTLCDNCRCLDCQSRYFECDDSDSFSEISFLGDLYYDLPQAFPQDSIQHPSSSSPCHNQDSADCMERSEPNNPEPLSDLSTDDTEIYEQGATQ